MSEIPNEDSTPTIATESLPAADLSICDNALQSVDTAAEYKCVPLKLSSGETITVLSRSENPQGYVSISHVWGKIFKQKDDWNTLNSSETLISSNSKLKALKKLIRHSESVWCDVYCISQSDMQQKCAQVSIMDKIYDNCTKCLILLDPSDGIAFQDILNDHNAVVDVIKELVNNIDQIDEISIKEYALKAMKLKEIADRVRYGPLPIEYFKRAWTLQEIVYPCEFEVFTFTMEGDLVPIADLSHSVESAKNAQDWWYKVVYPDVVRETENLNLTNGQSNAFRHLCWSLINSKFYRALKGAGYGNSELCTIDLMERADNYIFNNIREASVSHDLVYAVMKLLGISDVTVDYSVPFREILKDFYLECLNKGILHVAHFISYLDGNDEKASGYGDFDRDEAGELETWMGSVISSSNKPVNSMKLLNRRWVNDMPERRLPKPEICSVSEDKKKLTVRAAIPYQRIQDDGFEPPEEMLKWINNETDMYTGKRIGDMSYRVVKRFLLIESILFEVIGNDGRLLLVFAYDCNQDLSMGHVYSQRNWSPFDKLAR
ncbi:hypothetical protein HK096_007924, partial [Nowakowskiella sp. JEL0078]